MTLNFRPLPGDAVPVNVMPQRAKRYDKAYAQRPVRSIYSASMMNEHMGLRTLQAYVNGPQREVFRLQLYTLLEDAAITDLGERMLKKGLVFDIRNFELLFNNGQPKVSLWMLRGMLACIGWQATALVDEFDILPPETAVKACELSDQPLQALMLYISYDKKAFCLHVRALMKERSLPIAAFGRSLKPDATPDQQRLTGYNMMRGYNAWHMHSLKTLLVFLGMEAGELVETLPALA